VRQVIGAAALAAALIATPAFAATTTFAQYKQIGGTDTVSFSGGNTLSSSGFVVEFNYLDPMPPALDGNINAVMTLSATGAPYSGTMSFLRQGDNANLLTVTFGGALLFGIPGGGSATFLDSIPGAGPVTFTSDFLDFSTSTERNFSLAFSGLTNPFGSPSWTADSDGTFASDSRTGPGGGPVPEPATWGMMIVGFGGVGVLLRRRRTTVAFA
jgi:PEP-CTERM motif